MNELEEFRVVVLVAAAFHMNVFPGKQKGGGRVDQDHKQEDERVSRLMMGKWNGESKYLSTQG